jgi:hypothetical protein
MPVEVGPLLAVDLDADEGGVEDAGDLFVPERFPFHDVAPMAGRVADGKEDGLVLPPRPLEGLVPPGEPVHGIAGVLKEIRALFLEKAVGMFHGTTCLPAVSVVPGRRAGGKTLLKQ